MKHRKHRSPGCSLPDRMPGIDFRDPLTKEIKARVLKLVDADDVPRLLAYTFDEMVRSDAYLDWSDAEPVDRFFDRIKKETARRKHEESEWEPVIEEKVERRINWSHGYDLWLFGFSAQDIASAIGVTGPAVQLRARRHQWPRRVRTVSYEITETPSISCHP